MIEGFFLICEFFGLAPKVCFVAEKNATSDTGTSCQQEILSAFERLARRQSGLASEFIQIFLPEQGFVCKKLISLFFLLTKKMFVCIVSRPIDLMGLASVAQSAERNHGKVEVSGSIPLGGSDCIGGFAGILS